MWKPWPHQQAWEWNGRPRSRILRKFIVIKERPWAAANEAANRDSFILQETNVTAVGWLTAAHQSNIGGIYFEDWLLLSQPYNWRTRLTL